MCAVECVDIQLHKFKITQITKFDFVFCLSCWETIGVLLAKIFLPPPPKNGIQMAQFNNKNI